MEYQKPMWNDKYNCWCVGDIKVPNWTPNDVKLPDHMMTLGNWYADALSEQLGIKKEKNMNEKDTKIIVEQLEEKLKTLLACKENWMRQMAMVGSRLKECIDEIDNLEAVLEKFVDDEDCEDDDE